MYIPFSGDTSSHEPFETTIPSTSLFLNTLHKLDIKHVDSAFDNRKIPDYWKDAVNINGHCSIGNISDVLQIIHPISFLNSSQQSLQRVSYRTLGLCAQPTVCPSRGRLARGRARGMNGVCNT